MVDRSDVAELIERAVEGDADAWQGIVHRYTPLLMSVLRGYRLCEADLRDITQTVWLRLVEHLSDLREPRALPGWLITTTRNEAIKTLRSNQRATPVDSAEMVIKDDVALDDDLLRVERREALLEAFAELNDLHRELLTLLSADPAVPYAEISARLHIAVGSIGPTRARALDKLRQCPSLKALGDSIPVSLRRG